MLPLHVTHACNGVNRCSNVGAGHAAKGTAGDTGRRRGGFRDVTHAARHTRHQALLPNTLRTVANRLTGRVYKAQLRRTPRRELPLNSRRECAGWRVRHPRQHSHSRLPNPTASFISGHAMRAEIPCGQIPPARAQATQIDTESAGNRIILGEHNFTTYHNFAMEQNNNM